MDTRQLQAFCEVVERKSFSLAAERLGVTQPAVSLQVRALEKRLGAQLLDRSGRRVEPTEAGVRLYRGAQRLLALEAEITKDLAEEATGALAGTLRDRRVDRARRRRPLAAPLPVRRRPPRAARRARASSTRRPSSIGSPTGRSRSASSAPRRVTGASSTSRSSATRHPRVPARPRIRRAARSRLDELRGETLIVMQEGAGVRQLIEDELRRVGVRLARPRRPARARAAGVGHERRPRRLRRDVHLALLRGERPRRGHASSRHGVAGHELEREIHLVRASGRSETRAARAFIEFARERLG